MATSPTRRTLVRLRSLGWTADVTERWIPKAKKRKDLFGFIDVVAIRADKAGVLGIQCTTVSNQAARLTKLLAIPATRTWLLAGNRVQVWGWKKRSGRWEVTKRDVQIEDLGPCQVPATGPTAEVSA